MCYVKCINQWFIYELLQVKVILSGNETRWQVGSRAGHSNTVRKYELNSAGAQTGQPKPDVLHLTHAVALFVSPQTLKPFPRHLVPEWLNYNTQQNISCLGADWSSWNCNLDSYFYAISFVNDADSAAFSFRMAAAWKQALLLFSLNKWQHNHNALQNSESRQVGKNSDSTRVTGSNVLSISAALPQFCYRCIERTPTRPLTFKKKMKMKISDAVKWVHRTNHLKHQTSSQSAIWWLL